MRRPHALLLSLAALSIVGTFGARLAAQAPAPIAPIAAAKPKVDTLHGEIRTDNYFWIRDKSNPDVIAYLNAENAYTETKMKHTEALQKKLYDEMLSRIKETDVSVPTATTATTTDAAPKGRATPFGYGERLVER
jgi:hypothetical protein